MKKKNKQKGPVIYVGPGFRDTDLTTFKIFADGIPENYVGNPTYELLLSLLKNWMKFEGRLLRMELPAMCFIRGPLQNTRRKVVNSDGIISWCAGWRGSNCHYSAR